MTRPDEEHRALVNTRQFLLDLLDRKKTPRVPMNIRLQARALAKHYPAPYRIEESMGIGPDITRPAGTLFAELFEVYLKSGKEIKEVIESMTKVINDPNADADERTAALDTLIEVLFPRSRTAR